MNVGGNGPVTLSLAEQIAQHLTREIMAGRYIPGESLGEQAISDMFNVSRAPVREALRILERDGVVQIVPRHGARITELTYDELLEAYEIRAGLFGMATARFARAHSAEAMAEVRRHFAELEKLAPVDVEATVYGNKSAELARAIINNCGGARLITLIYQFDYQIARYRHLGLATPAMRKESIDKWKRLMAALKSGDDDAAERIGREIILRTRDAAAPYFAEAMAKETARPGQAAHQASAAKRAGEKVLAGRGSAK